MPRHITVLLLMYLGVILVGFLWALLDRSNIENYPVKNLVSEELINTVKWVLPGILLFDGCRTRRRVVMTVACVLAMYFLLAIQIAKRFPPSAVLSGDTIEKAAKLCMRIGYSRVDMSTFLAGTFWGIIAAMSLVRQKKYKMFVLAAAGITAFAQAATGGRAGYLAWGATGLVLCLLKWRKYLVLAPVIMILLPLIFPGPVERMLKGFGEIDVAGQSAIDSSSVTSGRMEIWPYVIDKISESPIVGYGRLAMRRTGLYDQMTLKGHTGFTHAHNMYLETLLDNGILGSLPIFLFWGIVVIYSARLFKSDNRLYSVVGGFALSLVLVQLFAGIGSQHFYPEESTLGMWIAMFLSLRVYLEQARTQENLMTTENFWNGQLLQPQQVADASGYAYGMTLR
ncbi:O-antigen ligase family protein [Planctomycetota bacterium]